MRKHGDVREATAREVARSIRTLRSMAAPAPTAAAPAASSSASTAAAGSGSGAAAGLGGVAACESGGDPTAVSPDGQYRGKYQFDTGTWQSVGGTGDPAAAPEAVQDQLAAKLAAQRGSSPWPVCGG